MSIKTVMFDLDGTLLPMHIYTLPIPLSSVSDGQFGRLLNIDVLFFSEFFQYFREQLFTCGLCGFFGSRLLFLFF